MQNRPQARLTNFTNVWWVGRFLVTSIPIYFTFCQKIKMAAVRGATMFFPILSLKCHSKYQKIDTFYAVIFYNVEC